MALPNLSGSNIQDTYQRVLHTDGTLLYNGTGSIIDVLNVTASHAVVETTKEVSSSYAETASMASSNFIVQGEITASGAISSSTNVYAAHYLANGTDISSIYSPMAGNESISYVGVLETGEWNGNPIESAYLDGDTAHLSQTQTFTGAKTFTNTDSGNGTVFLTPITASGAISSSGRITAAAFYNDRGPLFNNPNFAGSITASGVAGFVNISASGTITANHIESDNLFSRVGDANTGIQLGSDTVTIEGNDVKIGIFTSTRINLNAPVTASIISASGTITANNYVNLPSGIVSGSSQLPSGIVSGSSQLPSGIISSSQHIFTAITASGDISASGDIYAEKYWIEGKTAIDYSSKIIYGQNNQTATLRGDTIELGAAADQHVTASGNISASGTITANKIESDQLVSHVGDANTGLQFTSDTVIIEGNDLQIATFASNRIELNLPVTASGDISSSGTITANAFVGDTGFDTRRYGNVLKILPTDFIQNEDGGVNKSQQLDDTGTFGVRATSTDAELWAFIAIPEGMKATHTHIKGLDSGTDGSSADDFAIEVFEYSLSDGSTTSKGTGVVGTNFDHTDVSSSATNCLAIRVDTADITGTDTDVVYGGYVTIAAQ